MGVNEVFISYVREDERFVHFLRQILEINNIKVWTDKTKLQPGVLWKTAIENAIRNGAFFLNIHSKARQARKKSYANEELHVAIEEYRRLPPSTQWLIPIVIDDCDVDDWPISAVLKYSDIQRCDLRDWGEGISSLLRLLGVENPIIDNKKPLARGLPSLIKIQHGFVCYEHIDDMPQNMQGMEHRVTGGWCKRNDDGIVAYFELKAPLASMEKLNKILGYTGFYAYCEDDEISLDSQAPSTFIYDQNLIIPRGTQAPNFQGGPNATLPIDLPIRSNFTAHGAIEGMTFKGEFEAYIEFEKLRSKTRQKSNGHFEIQLGPDLIYYPDGFK